MNQTKIYGHRGAKGTYPENTILSFKEAILQGVDGIELDVHMTLDGEIVVIHDESLNRTTDGSGFVKDRTLDEIKRFSAGRNFTTFPNFKESWVQETVPTLKEVLQLLAPFDIELNIELKTYIFPYKGIEEKTLALVSEYGNSRKVIYSSFHLPTLLRLKQLDSSVNIAWLLHDKFSHLSDYINSLNLEALHLHKDYVLTYEDSLHDIHPFIRAWTVNNQVEINKLLDMQVEAIITDYPSLAIANRDKRIAPVE
ncbi:MAG TPA: glycerophosphodiester phosphodiesterase [Niallia sp.]|nr:glycerophosphodiester phosphodiesterase [Niallia sp.]